jgi:hypothetical protein
MADRYWDGTNGNDANDGLTMATAWKTYTGVAPAAWLSSMTSGDRIYRKGTFRPTYGNAATFHDTGWLLTLTSKTGVQVINYDECTIRGDTANLSGKDSSCLSALGKKKPGDSRKFTQEEQGVKLNYTCTFEGWGELSGKKVIVVGVKSDKQRVRRQQPNGVPAIAEMSGEGKILFLPEGPEALMRMKTDIDVEPTEEEIARLKASKGEISRNKSKMKHTSFLYPL